VIAQVDVSRESFEDQARVPVFGIDHYRVRGLSSCAEQPGP
jgi:hypothetical protein